MASDCGRCKRNPDIEDNWISINYAKSLGYEPNPSVDSSASGPSAAPPVTSVNGRD